MIFPIFPNFLPPFSLPPRHLFLFRPLSQFSLPRPHFFLSPHLPYPSLIPLIFPTSPSFSPFLSSFSSSFPPLSTPLFPFHRPLLSPPYSSFIPTILPSFPAFSPPRPPCHPIHPFSLPPRLFSFFLLLPNFLFPRTTSFSPPSFLHPLHLPLLTPLSFSFRPASLSFSPSNLPHKSLLINTRPPQNRRPADFLRKFFPEILTTPSFRTIIKKIM